MCGFAALIEPGRRFDAELLAGIDRDLYHRGPDSGGRLDQPGVAFVFRRLAILDPTPGSDQPMTDPSGRCTLVFNGEIYNYRALRAALEQAGVLLRTDGDTEAILEGYRLWGEGVVDRLEGMYAFAILDRQTGAVMAARDPFGIKPLYMMRRGRLVALASEMRPFARLAALEPDPAALAELLTFRWAAGRLSNLAGVERVPGGTMLRVSLADGSVDGVPLLRSRSIRCGPDDTIAARRRRCARVRQAVERIRCAPISRATSDIRCSSRAASIPASSLRLRGRKRRARCARSGSTSAPTSITRKIGAPRWSSATGSITARWRSAVATSPMHCRARSRTWRGRARISAASC